MRSNGAVLRIEVAYALPDRQIVVALDVPEGCTVEQAVTESRLPIRFPEISRSALNCSIYSRVVPLDQRLESGDRVEVLRPLLIDPKESRRQAAAKARSSNKTSK